MAKELTIINKDVSPIIQKAQSLVIKDAESMEQASDFRSKLKQEEKRLETDRLSMTAPINESLKKINDKYRPAKDTITQALKYLNDSMSSYQMASMKALREQEEKIANRIGEGSGHLTIETASRKIGELAPITAPTSTKFRSDYVLDVISLKDIPDKYFVLNDSMLLRDLKAGEVVSGAKLKEILIPVNSRTKNDF